MESDGAGCELREARCARGDATQVLAGTTHKVFFDECHRSVVAKESHDDPVPSITQIVQHTISTRLFSSFLNALKAPSTTAAAGTGRLDTDKIADIVSGKAHLGVLPAEPPAYTEKHRTLMPSAADTFDIEAEQALAMSFTNLKLATESIARSKSAAAGVVAGSSR
jgi:hypothetical protein